MIPEFTDGQIENGRVLFASECNFIAGVDSHERMIPMSLPEVAFVGRSNVGKSSLINAVTGQNALARTSHTPGRTQQLNFFNLRDRMFIVDLPGYGYARASKTKVKAWNKLIRDYLKGRATLHRVCVLIDSRHGIKDVDMEIMKMLDDAAVTYMIVLTKIDKIKSKEREARLKEVEVFIAKHAAAYPFIFETSSSKNLGIEAVRADLSQLAAGES